MEAFESLENPKSFHVSLLRAIFHQKENLNGDFRIEISPLQSEELYHCAYKEE